MLNSFRRFAAADGRGVSRWIERLRGERSCSRSRCNALAQAPAAPAGAAPPQSAQDLDNLVGRIALYPDDLVAIILPASTNPLQLVQADRFLDKRKTDPKLPVDEKWDDAVKSLLNYPDVVKMMSGDLDWTSALGEAVVADQGAVLDAIQAFRRKAQAAGNLKSRRQAGRRGREGDHHDRSGRSAGDLRAAIQPDDGRRRRAGSRTGATTRRRTRRTTTRTRPVPRSPPASSGARRSARPGTAATTARITAATPTSTSTATPTSTPATSTAATRVAAGGRRHARGSPTSSRARSAARSARPRHRRASGDAARWRRAGRPAARARASTQPAGGGMGGGARATRRVGQRIAARQLRRRREPGRRRRRRLRRLRLGPGADADGQLARRVEPQFDVGRRCARRCRAAAARGGGGGGGRGGGGGGRGGGGRR